MPTGVYQHHKLSEATKLKMSIWRKAHPVRYWAGKKQTAEHIAKRVQTYKPIASASHKGQIPWNKGVKGSANPLFGKPRPPHVLAILRASNIGRKATPETRLKLRISHLGHKHTQEQKDKIGNAHRGRPSPRRGNKSPLWKGGTSQINDLIRHSLEYRIWRRAVFQRDNYTCTNCGAKSGQGKTVKLNADHIKPFAYFPDLRFDINNGRTLCVQCHKQTPTYGSKVHSFNQYGK